MATLRHSSRQTDDCDLSCSVIPVIKTGNIIVFQVVRQAATRLVDGRRPSVLQQWGGSPDGLQLRSRRCRNRGEKESAMMPKE